MNKKILHYNAEDCDKNFPPKNLRSFIAFMMARIAEIPEDYRESAEIEFDYTSDIESIVITITYMRPEYEQERRWRETAEYTASRVQEKRERAELDRLLNKYGCK